jgi:hypothetical protein
MMVRVVWGTPEQLAGVDRDDAAGELSQLLNETPEDVTRGEVQQMAERIARARGLTERQKRHIADGFQQVIDEQG